MDEELDSLALGVDPASVDDDMDEDATPATGTLAAAVAAGLYPPRPVMVVDIDGTIADDSHRRALVPRLRKNKTEAWLAFSDACDRDLPILGMCALVLALSDRFAPLFITSRPERVRDKTEAWLRSHLGLIVDRETLLMRPDDATEPAHELKPRLLGAAGVRLADVAFALDDDPRVVEAWRALGVRCLDVGR